jgi:hypothetical protein
MPRKNKPGAGRPPKEVNLETLAGLARIQCTMSEMSAVLHVSVDTLERNYADVIKTAQESGRASLRRVQYLAAVGPVNAAGQPTGKGNPAMMIWLGKQLLGQRDRADLDLTGGLTVVWDESLGKL